jgi:hypothetical protein
MMARQVTVDFTDTEVGMGRMKIPEGDYGFRIAQIVSRKAQSTGNPVLVFGLKVIQGNKDAIGKILPHNCTLTKNSLWNLRNLLEATGKQVPSKALKIDLDKLIGLTLAGTVIDDQPYEGKIKSIITAFFPLADLNKKSEEETSGEETGETEEEADTTEENGEEEEELFD